MAKSKQREEALEHAGLQPVTLAAKEGLALINGTQAMTASATMTLLEAERSMLSCRCYWGLLTRGTQRHRQGFRSRIHAARPHPGQLESAENLRLLLQESEIFKSHAECNKVQDPYSLRCMPQVHGASRDALLYVRTSIRTRDQQCY